jgi:hypothetical protein
VDATLEAAARRWAHAYVGVCGADSAGLLSATLALDAATHDLIVAAGQPCPMCEPGSCPGADPLEGWEWPIRTIKETPPL